MKCKECKEVLAALGEFQEGLNGELVSVLVSIDKAFAELKRYVEEIHNKDDVEVNTCCQCETTTTPQWRTYDNRTYCNACGIRYYRAAK